LLKFASDFAQAQALLLDAHVEGYGGGGKAFHWSRLPPSVSCHAVLSGGLTPANVGDGILQVRPRFLSLAVDVSSGVECLKGIKDAGLIHQFVGGRAGRRRASCKASSMSSYSQPDATGHFGIYGGSFVSETLTHADQRTARGLREVPARPRVPARIRYELKHFVGRPSPVYHAERMSREQGGAQIYLKREDLNHTGAHKINNVIGQACWPGAWASRA
jgi:hypothetical protein